VDWLGEDVVETDLVNQIMANSAHHTSVLHEIHQQFVLKMDDAVRAEHLLLNQRFHLFLTLSQISLLGPSFVFGLRQMTPCA
jgi:hypothetical protein